ncbi:MAG: two-component system response regulator BaeR [Gammaproteobacteria bacterium]|jgi:two-component system response regulator BaeR
MSHAQILVVEDETRLATVLCEYLQQAGFDTHHLAEGNAVAAHVREHAPALVLLDLMLPGRDGLDVCRDIRAISQVPIIMLTARVEEIDRLLGLELGADDYMCKPYSPREVVARVRAVLRRVQASDSSSSEASAGERIEPNDAFTLDEGALRVRAHGKEVELTRVEFQLLQALHHHPGRIYSRAQLMDLIYPDRRIVSDRTIDSHVKKLRKKLSPLLSGEEVVQSVYGVGYRFEQSVEV